MENNAVCGSNQHCPHYALKLGKHNTPRGLDIPQCMEYKESRARNRCMGHSEARKPSPRSTQETLVGTKVGYGYRALLLGP